MLDRQRPGVVMGHAWTLRHSAGYYVTQVAVHGTVFGFEAEAQRQYRSGSQPITAFPVGPLELVLRLPQPVPPFSLFVMKELSTGILEGQSHTSQKRTTVTWSMPSSVKMRRCPWKNRRCAHRRAVSLGRKPFKSGHERTTTIFKYTGNGLNEQTHHITTLYTRWGTLRLTI